MKSLKSILLVLFIFTSLSLSQNKTFTNEDVVVNSYTSLAPTRLRGLQWIPKTNDYSYVQKNGEIFNLVKASASSGKLDKLFSQLEFNNLLKQAGLDEIKRLPNFRWIDKDNLQFRIGNKFYNYNPITSSTNLTAKANDKSSNIFFAPNNKYIAFTEKNNLFFSSDTNNVKQITFDKNEHIINGQSVHRNEFGIVKGIFWSPKSNYIAFYHKDETMVSDYPIVNFEPIPAKLESIKYPMAGQTSHQVKVGIYNVNTDETVWLKTGEPLDHYLTCVTWSPDEKYIFIAVLNRDQNHMQLNKYDIATGNKGKTLFEEKQDKYVEPEHQIIFLPNNSEKFLWFSKRDGWNHLYLYNTDGRLITQVTKGKWEVLSFDGFDKYGKNIFITATKKNPIEKQFYKVEVSTSRITQISKDKGVHRVLPNFNGTYFIDTYSNLKTPRITKILNDKGNTLSVIHRSNNPIKDYAVGDVKIFTLKNQDSTDLYCRMVLPPDFDASKKYPVIVYVYGGPHVQLVTNRWIYGRYAFWFYRMAQKGFIIFTLDNRGSANRGLAFEQATFRHLGTEEVKDQMVGVKYLKSLPYVDSTRFGVFGWSFGGFMTTSLMLRTNNTFKVGVGGGAVIDWRMYEVMYTERYMDTPEANPEGYEESSLLNYVQNLNGKLLLVHGTSDPTVVWQHTLKFAKKAADLDKPLDYFPYVGHHHGVVGKDALHLYKKITNYFLDNL
ncbi:prolyl tripeptidyl peptidase precursor [bacterium BMS3Abin04]|nr:prolyl tripeptidyl peptidase precursor [bacterium BMS3Abin04]